MSDDEAGPGPSSRPSLFERFVPPVDLLGEDGEPRPSRMTPREQMVAVGLGLANVAIAAGAARAMDNQQGLALLVGLVASAVTVVGARVGNRILAMLGLFASVVTRSGNTVVFLSFGLPYYAAALWMFMKYNRLVKSQALLRRQQREESKGSGGTRASTGSTKGKAGNGKVSDRSRPTASKRYTPPKPPKKRPPPPAKPPRDRSPVD